MANVGKHVEHSLNPLVFVFHRNYSIMKMIIIIQITFHGRTEKEEYALLFFVGVHGEWPRSLLNVRCKCEFVRNRVNSNVK